MKDEQRWRNKGNIETCDVEIRRSVKRSMCISTMKMLKLSTRYLCDRPADCFGNGKGWSLQVELLNKAASYLKVTSNVGIESARIHKKLDWFVGLSHASFADAPGVKSQLGLNAIMTDNQSCANTVPYVICRYHRMSRLLMTGDICALVRALEHAYIVCEIIVEL